MDTPSLKSALKKLKNKLFCFRGGKFESQIRSFEEDQEYEKAFDTVDRGTCEVPLNRIVGSVGRYNDFDERFRLKQHVPTERLDHIKEAMRTGKPLPPVKLYQLKDEYYVLDGNHRIAAAKEFNHETVLARIVEFIPTRSTFENILYREKAAFQEKTGLPDNIHLSEVGQYERLISQIYRHMRHIEKTTSNQSISLKIAAKDWYETIYLPLTSIIEKAKLIDAFPARTTADLYSYISYHQWERMGDSRQFGFEVDQLIPDSMENFRSIVSNRKIFEYPEMHRIITAFILMKVHPKKEYRIVDRLFSLDEVREVHSVHGETDIIVKIVLKRDLLCSDAEKIGQFVHENMRQISGVISTATLIPGYSKTKEIL